MIKEEKKRNIIEALLYFILIIIGIVIMSFPAFGLIDPIFYLAALFYIYSFFIVIAYFATRKEKEYELLFNALISIIVASFLMASPSTNVSFMLGTSMLIYTLLLVVNRGFIVYNLKGRNDYLWVIKFIITFLVAFLGILTIINLYNELSVQTLIIGYYFVTLGVMLITEPLFKIFISPSKFNKIVKKIIEEDKKEENTKPIKTKIEHGKSTNKKTEAKRATSRKIPVRKITNKKTTSK